MFARTATTGNEVFLKSRYMEIGVSAAGSFGTATAPPAGFNNHVGSTYVTDLGLGFTADYGRDGYTVGTPKYRLVLQTPTLAT